MSTTDQELIIAGIGQMPVGEHWELSLRNMAAHAMLAAMRDSGGLKPQAIYAGNYLASVLSRQANLGTLMAECIALEGVEAFTVEAGEASGAAALNLAVKALRSGFVDCAMVVGVEKVTDVVGAEVESAINQTLDADFEGMQGLGVSGVAALLMQRYLNEHQAPREAFAAFPILAHKHALGNPNAWYRREVTVEDYQRAGMVCDPLNRLDVAPFADGAAAVLIARRDRLPQDFPQPLVKVSASKLATDSLSLHDRANPLSLDAARFSFQKAFDQAAIEPAQIDLFEYWDAYSIYAALQLECAGFAQPGQGWKLAQDGQLDLGGQLSCATLGGLKARGFPLGAAGVYQVVEAVLQLCHQAGANQVQGARTALVQSLGGPASTAVTHILQRI
jgi:acetyl-CoA C-acetyltransferase